jgi:hypothetical protein
MRQWNSAAVFANSPEVRRTGYGDQPVDGSRVIDLPAFDPSDCAQTDSLGFYSVGDRRYESGAFQFLHGGRIQAAQRSVLPGESS